ncbi:MAG: sensor protein [Gemmatimonadetes bacterium]|nr:sensor protein [Gemmatimonadota bacterium]
MSDPTPSNGPPSSAATLRADTQLRAIIESLADGILIVDAEGLIQFANPAAGRLFTRTPEALVGTPVGTPVVGGETTEMEIVRRGGGEVVYAELRVVDIEWESRAVKLVSLRDVTDRKYAEERSRQLTHERDARLKAEAASRAKSDFLAIMSHELRTPLNAILGYSELVELGISGEISDTIRDQMGRVRRAAKHLLGLVNDILDLAKFEAGRLVVANTPAVAAEAVASALALVQPQAEARNLTLAVTPEVNELPPYIGDEERVRQILVNLLSNAVKCTDPGGSITIDGEMTTTPDPRARLQPRRAHLRLSIIDTGTGIAPEKLAAIFEPFVQAEQGPTRPREGSGLGLTIGLRLARAMGGDLTVESTVGIGSIFTLWLPANDANSDVNAAEVEGVRRRPSRALESMRNVEGLMELSNQLVMRLRPLVDVVVARIRADTQIEIASGLRTSQVTDHLTTLLADIAGALVVIEEVNGEPSALLADAVEIQRMIAERHGAQRARLGWTETSLRREFMIIREELELAVMSCMPAGKVLQPNEALAIIGRFIDQAEYLSVRGLERTRTN